MIDREQLRAMFGGRCAYCGRPLGAVFHADHMESRYRGGASDGILFPACPRCNLRKGVFSIEEFRAEISDQVERLRRNSRQFALAEDFGLIQATGQEVSFWFERHPAPEKGEKE
jgi:5-methylcytosine-specific restriction endonuclease McrA